MLKLAKKTPEILGYRDQGKYRRGELRQVRDLLGLTVSDKREMKK
jgi:hypothetical protein